jgi:hypothetical protein
MSPSIGCPVGCEAYGVLPGTTSRGYRAHLPKSHPVKGGDMQGKSLRPLGDNEKSDFATAT